MNTLQLRFNKIDFEKVIATLGFALMEASGIVFMVCGLLDIKFF